MAVFFIAGMLYASWGVHVPTVRDKFQLSPGSLSIALLAVAVGSIVAMLTNGPWIGRVGTRRACLAGGIGMTICAALILVAPFYWLLLVVLALFGFSMATLDVAMNAEASAVEEALERPIMSSLHGMFSVGGMAGAAAGGAMLAHGMPPAAHLALASVVSLIVLLVSMPAVLPHVPHVDDVHGGRSSSNRWRSKALWALGSLALIALIAEGAMYDWATVYMRDVVLATPALSSAAYAAFTGGMAAGRFGGDVVRARFGAPQLIFASAALAFIGMVAALLLPNAVVTLRGLYADGPGAREHDAGAVRRSGPRGRREPGRRARAGRRAGLLRLAVRTGADRRRGPGEHVADRVVGGRSLRGADRARGTENDEATQAVNVRLLAI